MPKKVVITTKAKEVKPPPPPDDSPNEDTAGDPVFNAETKQIEHLTVVPKVEEEEPAAAPLSEEEWLTHDFEGQLSVDVYQTDKDIVIKSTIAGVRPEDIDIQVSNDMVTIKGIRRQEEEAAAEDYFYRECYWGGFSRSVILPVDVRNDLVNATIKNGVLIIRLPKTEIAKVRVVKVKE